MPILIALGVLVLIVLSGLVTVNQGNVAVVTIFGKYRRHPSSRTECPHPAHRKNLQTHFHPKPFDGTEIPGHYAGPGQRNFSAMMLYAVLNPTTPRSRTWPLNLWTSATSCKRLVRSVEGSVRAFVATKRQSEILQLRMEIIQHVKEQLDVQLEGWGFHLLDLQINDITFDEVIMRSMAQVVASNNLKAAAENEGQALLITKTKAAEADGNAIKISAEAEKLAAKLRGEGVALFREQVAHGMAQAAREMESANLDASFILFSMWTDAIKHFAENGQGNTIFLDGSNDAMQRTMQQMQAILQNSKASLTSRNRGNFGYWVLSIGY